MGCVVVICCIIFLGVPMVTLLSLSLVTHNPRLYIQDMYVPGLINTTTTTQSTINATRLNTFIFIDLELTNMMPVNGIRYGQTNLSFSYGGDRTIATHTIPRFYQGHGKTANRREVVRTHDLPWEEAFLAVSNGSKVVVGVDLVTTVRLARFGIFGKRKEFVVRGNVELDNSGEIVKHKTIRLR